MNSNDEHGRRREEKSVRAAYITLSNLGDSGIRRKEWRNVRSNQDRMEKDVRRQMPAHDARRHGSNQGKKECPEMKQRTGVTAASRTLQGIMPSSRKDERRAAHLKPVGVGRTNNMEKPPYMRSHD